MQKRIIVLNGAPSSGKDAIAHQIFMGGGFYKQEVKETLFQQAIVLAQLTREEWFERYNNRATKELAWDKLGGLSCREWMIKVSEEYVKPVFGKNFYGVRAAEIASKHNYNVVFSDCGFKEEFDELVKKFGAENVLLVRIHREGCSFEGDSRSFLSNPEQEFDVLNEEGKLDVTVKTIKKHCEKIWGSQY